MMRPPVDVDSVKINLREENTCHGLQKLNGTRFCLTEIELPPWVKIPRFFW